MTRKRTKIEFLKSVIRIQSPRSPVNIQRVLPAVFRAGGGIAAFGLFLPDIHSTVSPAAFSEGAIKLDSGSQILHCPLVQAKPSLSPKKLFNAIYIFFFKKITAHLTSVDDRAKNLFSILYF